MTIEGDGPYPIDWSRLVPPLVHPLKVTVLEVMAWIGRPLSPADLARVLDGHVGLSLLDYHVKRLAEAGVLEEVDSRKRRGATEHFFFFAEDL